MRELMALHFPFLGKDDIESILRLCEKNHRLFYFPEIHYLLGYFQFYPEIINVVREQDFETLLKCDLTHGPLIYVSVLITEENALRIISAIVRTLNARAYAFHRYRNGEPQFHFVRNNRWTELCEYRPELS